MMTQFAKYSTLLAFGLTCSLMCPAQTATVGGGLDCNGLSPISHNVKRFMACTDPRATGDERFEDNGRYIGHDEPSVRFLSSRPKSGSNMVWRLTLPKKDPVPTQSGSRVATFELTPAIWISLALCDSNSYPQNPCKPASDRNTGTGVTTDAGSAVLELQFYPPGLAPALSCDATHWCAALNIDSLECNYGFAVCNANCTEPVNFAFLQTNGIPPGPPAPGQQTAASFTPNAQTLLMNPGDDLLITIKDTRGGLLTAVFDRTTGAEGFMVAGGSSGFEHTDLNSCQTTPYNFHPEFSSAKIQNAVPWAALVANVNLAVETGHFELGATGDMDADDSECFTGPPIDGCLDFSTGGDLDFDGPPYRRDWPDGSRRHPSPVLIGAANGRGIGPMSFTHREHSADDDHSEDENFVGYSALMFESDVPYSDSNCDFTTGKGCVAPPAGAKFYPFYSQIGKGRDCELAFGNDIEDETTNDFGKDAQYGSPTPGDLGNLSSAAMPNPCTP
jgi:hypothetical protein